MENCLLCLDINNEIVDNIKVDSKQWQEQNMKYIIEKHLWPLEYILPKSWVCSICWRTLSDFHKFYIRIEEAHIEFSKLMTIEKETEMHDAEIKGYLSDNYRDNDVGECKYLIDEISPELHENGTVDIKKETVLSEDNIPLIQFCKRKCASKNVKANNNKDPLTNVETAKGRRNKSTNSSKLLDGTNEKSTKDDNKNSEFLVDKIAYFKSSESDYCMTDSDYEYKEKLDEMKNSNRKSSRKRDHSKIHPKDVFLSENFKMICPLCQIPMNTFKNLLNHFEVEHKEPGYAVCCDKKFYKRGILLEHVQRHVDPNCFKCNQCGKVLSARKVLKTHQLLHQSEEEDKFNCTECGKNFRSNLSLSNHIRVVHLKKYNKICHLCGVSIAENIKFKHHMLKHQGEPVPKLSCQFCGRRLADKKCLKRHINSHHPPEGIKPEFNCHICEKVFTSLANVKKHIKAVHENSYENKCTMCDKSFKRSDALRDHMARHTGTPLHACGWCPKTFYSNGQMYAHRKNVHPEEWQEAIRKKFSGNLPEKYKI